MFYTRCFLVQICAVFVLGTERVITISFERWIEKGDRTVKEVLAKRAISIQLKFPGERQKAERVINGKFTLSHAFNNWDSMYIPRIRIR